MFDSLFFREYFGLYYCLPTNSRKSLTNALAVHGHVMYRNFIILNSNRIPIQVFIYVLRTAWSYRLGIYPGLICGLWFIGDARARLFQLSIDVLTKHNPHYQGRRNQGIATATPSPLHSTIFGNLLDHNPPTTA